MSGQSEITQDTTASTNVHVYGDGIHSAEANEPAHFQVDARLSRNARGQPEAILTGIRHEEHIPLDEDVHARGLWSATYTPHHKGHYLLKIMWDGSPVDGSPFSVQVHGPEGTAGKVIVEEDKLKECLLGQAIQADIDTRLAGLDGHLRAHCQGPSKQVDCNL